MPNQQSASSGGSTYVYLLSNPFNLMPFYVGIANNPRQRLRDHAAKYPNVERRQIIDSIRAAGGEHHLTVVDIKPSLELARQSELAWIEKYRRLNFPIVNRELAGDLRQAAVLLHLAALGALHGVARRPGAPAMRRASQPGKPENHGQP